MPTTLSCVCYGSRYFIILRVTASKPKFFLMAIIVILETQTRNEKLLGLHEIYHFHFNFNNTEIVYLHSTNHVLYFLLLGVLERHQPIRPLTFHTDILMYTPPLINRIPYGLQYLRTLPKWLTLSW